jgi:hypothetical protein
MAFTFNNYATNNLQQNPLNDIIKNMFSGYSNMTNAQFLRPNLQEQLKKSQLYNQYYGPNMESQIGLRGAQAGHLGALTQGQNITNQYLPKTLQEEIALKAAQRELYGAQTQHYGAETEGLNQANELDKKYPNLKAKGLAGQLANFFYMQDQNSKSGANQPQQMQDSESYIPVINKQPINDRSQALQKAIAKTTQLYSQKEGAPTTVLRNVNYLRDAEQGWVPGTDQTQRFENEEIQKRTINALKNALPQEHGQKTEHQKAIDAAANFDHMPADARKLLLGQAAAMGVTPDRATNLLRSGKLIEDIAKMQGFDPENMPPPSSFNSPKDLSTIKARNAALNEHKVIGDFVTKSLAPYSRTFEDYSPKQIIDSIMHSNPKQLRDFLAARALQPELNNLRIITAGGKPTVHALKQMQEKSMNNIHAFQSLVDKEDWAAAQSKVEEILGKGLNAANKAYDVVTKKNDIAQALVGDKEKTYNFNGKKYSFNEKTNKYEELE